MRGGRRISRGAAARPEVRVVSLSEMMAPYARRVVDSRGADEAVIGLLALREPEQEVGAQAAAAAMRAGGPALVTALLAVLGRDASHVAKANALVVLGELTRDEGSARVMAQTTGAFAGLVKAIRGGGLDEISSWLAWHVLERMLRVVECADLEPVLATPGLLESAILAVHRRGESASLGEVGL